MLVSEMLQPRRWENWKNQIGELLGVLHVYRAVARKHRPDFSFCAIPIASRICDLGMVWGRGLER